MESFSEWNAGIIPISEHVPTLIKVWLSKVEYNLSSLRQFFVM